jgi:hypothetical protein
VTSYPCMQGCSCMQGCACAWLYMWKRGLGWRCQWSNLSLVCALPVRHARQLCAGSRRLILGIQGSHLIRTDVILNLRPRGGAHRILYCLYCRSTSALQCNRQGTPPATASTASCCIIFAILVSCNFCNAIAVRSDVGPQPPPVPCRILIHTA